MDEYEGKCNCKDNSGGISKTWSMDNYEGYSIVIVWMTVKDDFTGYNG